MRLNNVAVALCHVHKKHLGQAWRQETDAGICFEKKDNRWSLFREIS